MTGSQAMRNVRTLGDIINVRAPYFGAKGDSSTSDRAAIQLALDYAHANNARGIYIPGLASGNYYALDSYLWLWPDLEIFGDGYSSYLRNVNDGGVSPTRQAIFALGYYGTGGVDDIGREISFESIAISATAAGDSKLTLTNPGTDFSKFAEGQMVLVYNDTTETWGGKGSRTNLECARVIALSSPYVYLDRTLHKASSPAHCSISGRAALTSGINTPTGHVLQVIPGLNIHDLRLRCDAFGTFPGYIYRAKIHNCHSDGPYGFSADFTCESEIHSNHFAYCFRGIELALRSHGTLVHDNILYCDSARAYSAPSEGAYGLWTDNGARRCRFYNNKLYSNQEWAPLEMIESSEDCEFSNNHTTGVATTTTKQYADITLVDAISPIMRDNVLLGGNKFYVNIKNTSGMRVHRNRHLAPACTVEQCVSVQTSGTGCSGSINENVYDGNVTYDFNGMSNTNLAIEFSKNSMLGDVTNPTAHPMAHENSYALLRDWAKGSQAFTNLTDATETTIFSHTIAGREKKYTRWVVEQYITDTMVPAVDKTAKLKVDGTTYCTLTIPSAFGRARTKLTAYFDSRADNVLKVTLKAEIAPFAGGTVQIQEMTTEVVTTATSAHALLVSLTAAATSTCSINLTMFRQEAAYSNQWVA